MTLKGITKMKKTLLTTCMVLALGACDHGWMYESSTIVNDKPALVDVQDVERYPSLKLSANTLDHIAGRYHDMGAPSLKMTAIYDPSKDPHFCDEPKVNSVKYGLRNRGVSKIVIDKMPVEGARSQLLLNYEGLELVEAEQCRGQVIPGMDGTSTDNNMDYSLGCSMNRHMIAQIANPEHAQGVAGLSGDSMTGERAANILNGHNGTDEPMDYIPGYTLSDIGQSAE
ncbi:MAG: hypothetical protein CMH32_00645 [Micavibrio sp.]|nr:hypothetical protein [Micavibrio sp.]